MSLLPVVRVRGCPIMILHAYAQDCIHQGGSQLVRDILKTQSINVSYRTDLMSSITAVIDILQINSFIQACGSSMSKVYTKLSLTLVPSSYLGTIATQVGVYQPPRRELV